MTSIRVLPKTSCYRVAASPATTRARCRLAISVGQDYHEGEKFEAAVDWVNRYAQAPFQDCVVLVGDTLQRHNAIMRGMDPIDARVEARRHGDAWITRNMAAINGLRVPWRIARWDEALGDARYAELHARIESIATRPDMNSAIRADERKLIRRWRNRGETLDSHRFTVCHYDYFLEEVAAFAVMDIDFPAVTCYPAKLRNAWQIFPSVPDAPEELASLEWRYLHISRRRGSPRVGRR